MHTIDEMLLRLYYIYEKEMFELEEIVRELKMCLGSDDFLLGGAIGL